jgi:hypothetical protein
MKRKSPIGKSAADKALPMVKMLVASTPAPRNRKDSLRLLGNSMRDKILAFVVEDKDLSLERTPLKFVFARIDASIESTVMSYSYFFTHDDSTADVLIMRSSRAVASNGNLKSSLEAFKARNPKAVVIACAYGDEVTNTLLPLVDEGLIHKIEHQPPNDFELLRTAAKIMERLEQG